MLLFSSIFKQNILISVDRCYGMVLCDICSNHQVCIASFISASFLGQLQIPYCSLLCSKLHHTMGCGSIHNPGKHFPLDMSQFYLWHWLSKTQQALQCNPINAAWQPWVPARCLSIKWIQVGNAVPNITTDFIILSLPLTQIRKLKATFAQKISLCITFLIGGL